MFDASQARLPVPQEARATAVAQLGVQNWRMAADSESSAETASVKCRLDGWRHARNYVAIGNLGEHIVGRLLTSLGYQLLGAQDDFLGMVPEVLNTPSTAKPEDFIAIDPQERLLTVNSKASVSPRACRLLQSGDLSTPQIGRRQRTIGYTTQRASLISPLDGDAYSQVVKVDLVNMKAQIFDIERDGRLSRVGAPHSIGASAAAVLHEFTGFIPPPNIADLTWPTGRDVG
jgi:hypothetical protein